MECMNKSWQSLLSSVTVRKLLELESAFANEVKWRLFLTRIHDHKPSDSKLNANFVKCCRRSINGGTYNRYSCPPAALIERKTRSAQKNDQNVFDKKGSKVIFDFGATYLIKTKCRNNKRHTRDVELACLFHLANWCFRSLIVFDGMWN